MSFHLTAKRALAAMLAPAIFVVAALLSTSLSATEPSPSAALWKLSDSDSEIYLFGTVHILKPDTKWRSEKISSAFNSSETVYFEAAVEETPPGEMQQIMFPYMMNPKGTTLSSRFSPEVYEQFKNAAAKYGIPEVALTQFEPLRPWIVTITLSVQQMVQSGFNPESGVDKILFKEAKAAGKSISYLESVESQIRVFGDLTEEQENNFFKVSMGQIDEGAELLNNLVEKWSTGDAEAVGDLMHQGMKDIPSLKKALLDTRNENWANQIDEMMKGSGKTFIAVGAGHLSGTNSVQDYLEAKGYKIERQ